MYSSASGKPSRRPRAAPLQCQLPLREADGCAIEVTAFDPSRTDNARLMADVAALGYLDPTLDTVLDTTYGRGGFWRSVRPTGLVTLDCNAELNADHVGDFTALPFDDEAFDVVVFDPPYKLNGTPSGGDVDVRYGVGEPTRWQDRMKLIGRGVGECARVTSRVLLVKCQDQVVSGRVVWQRHHVAACAGDSCFSLVDELHVFSMRPQPKGRRQVHARRNFSTLLVFEHLR